MKERWIIKVFALLIAVAGIVNLFSAITPALSERLFALKAFLPLEVRVGSRLTAALAGFALLVLSGSVWRHKRTAWWLSLLWLSISSVSHLLKGLNYEEALFTAVLAVFLLFIRPYFWARSDPPSIRQGIKTLLLALLFTLTYGTIGFYWLDTHYHEPFSLLGALQQTIVMFFASYSPGSQPITGFGRYFADSIYVIGATTLLYALWMLMRPVLLREPATATERARAWQIVSAYGCSSLARTALLEDKSYFFSPGGSVIAFTSKNHTALALGDPIGPQQDRLACIQAFQTFCTQNDWQPAFLAVKADDLELYQRAGLKTLEIGQEAIIELESFSLEGSQRKNIRNSYNRLRRLGYCTAVLEPPLSADVLRELYEISNEWLSLKKSAEMRFSVGWFDEAYLNSTPLMVVYDSNKRMIAFANIVGEFQCNEVTIDLMRYRRNAESGLMDFLFVSLFEWAKAQGYATFSMGLSALSGVGEHSDDPAIERALNYIYSHMSQFYNFKGLHSFKEKFQPRWEARYLVYNGLFALPAIALALAQATAGQGSILTTYLRPRKSQP